MVGIALEAAEKLAADGIECEIIDPRTTSPLDEETIFETVQETGRLVVVDEAHPRCGMAADIAARVAQECFGRSRGRAPDGHGAARAGSVLAGARGPLRAGCGPD